MTETVRPRFVPTPTQDACESGRLTLRDGTTAQIRLATVADAEALAGFFRDLSEQSRYRRFLSANVPGTEFFAQLLTSDGPRPAVTLVVTRTVEGSSRIVATGSYLPDGGKTAEVALAVADAFQGKGLGTLLLERLALLGVRNGFTRFRALTGADNWPMLDVFRDSGFEVKSAPGKSDVEIDLTLTPTEASVTHQETRDRVATIASLRPFFQPNGVAVFGASRDPAAIGYRVFEGLLRAGFRGPVYPINPKATELLGHPVYKSVRDIPQPVDLAIVAVPAVAVCRVVDDCAARGVRGLVVITAGFAEESPAGAKLQQELTAKVRGYGMRLVGPNCLGLLNTDPAVQLNASFSPVFPPPGRIAMSSQSGAVGLAVLGAAARYGLGFSTFVSVGNKADVSGNDLLQYWEEDPHTDVILLYLESFGNPRRFSRIARRVGRRKPVVVLQSGLTRAGGRAAGSHTAALATNATAVEALFRQTGVVRAASLEEMFDLALTLGSQSPPKGPRVGIVTNAGGPAILATDACEASGLTVPEPSPALHGRLHALLPGAASIGNPIDLIASAGPQAYQDAIETLLSSGEYDSLLVLYTPVGLAKTADVRAAIAAGVATARRAGAEGRPVLACFLEQEEHRATLDCEGERIPCFPFPETPARVLGKVAAYGTWRASPTGVFPDFTDLNLGAARDICRAAVAERGASWLSASEVTAVLEAVGLPQAASASAQTADDAVRAATRIGFPVAVKLASRTLVHKSEHGGVHLLLLDEGGVRRAFGNIQDRLAKEGQLEAMEGVMVQAMVRGGTEVMIGATVDPLFGPLVAFGLGGVLVEVLADVSFRVAPLTDRDAAEMVRSVKGFRLLQGYRGRPAADVAAIEQALLRVSRLVEEVPEIRELDLNPVFAFEPGAGCTIADARIKVSIKRQ